MSKNPAPFLLLICLMAFSGYSSFDVSQADKDVDLRIQALQLNEVVVDKQTLAINGTARLQITNTGVEPVGAGFEVACFEDLDGDEAFTSGVDNLLGIVAVGQDLQPFALVEVAITLDGTVQFAGNRIFAIIDPNDVVSELDEANNVFNSAADCGVPVQPVALHPVLGYAWTGSDVEPAFTQVIATPIVIDLNQDGLPEIIFIATNNTGTEAGITPGILRAINGRTGEAFFNVTEPALRVQAGAQIAAGDIDDDGRPEIIVASADGRHLLCFEHDGTFKWRSAATRIDLGGAAIGDIDGDGQPEIVLGATVFRADGSVRARGLLGDGRNGGTGPLSLVVDLDNSGALNIIAGNTAYNADGSILWHNEEVGDGFVAIANLDDDPDPEIVLISIGMLTVLEHDGSIKWGPRQIPGGGIGGAPTIADVDKDGKPEIAIAGALRYTVFNSDGTVKWSRRINDISSGLTSSTIFDFEGDGFPEIVYGDQDCLHFFDGRTGEVRFEIRNPSGTLLENPVIADVDGDGRANLIAVRNQIIRQNPQPPLNQGVFIFTDSLNAWPQTRRVWNQYNYYVTHITTDGRVPTPQAKSWQTHNTFRANLVHQQPQLVPLSDLTASKISYDPCAERLQVRIGNGGRAAAPRDLPVAFFLRDKAGTDSLLAVAHTTDALRPGGFADITIAFAAGEADSVEIVVAANNDGTMPGPVAECDDSNNRHSAVLKALCETVSCSLTILAPADSSFICSDSVLVTLKHEPGDGATPITTICTVNGDTAVAGTSGLFSVLVSGLEPGYNSLLATCVSVDGLGREIVCSDTIVVFSDPTPPECVLDFSQHSDDSATVKGRIWDFESGIANIEIVNLVNRNIVFSPFTPGDTVVTFVSKRTGRNGGTRLDLLITNRAGCTFLCDPVSVRLDPPENSVAEITLPHVDRFLRIDNHGVREVSVTIGDEELQFLTQQDGNAESDNQHLIPLFGTYELDVATSLQDGDNPVHIRCDGPQGAYIVLLFTNFPLSETPTDILRADSEIDGTSAPVTFVLRQNYPNPFNAGTVITFEVPSGWMQPVRLHVYSSTGQLVARLLDGHLPPGAHSLSWDARDSAGHPVASGLYLYRLESGGVVQTRKLVVVR